MTDSIAKEMLFRLSKGMTIQETIDLSSEIFQKKTAVLLSTSGNVIAFSSKNKAQIENIQKQLEHGAPDKKMLQTWLDDNLLFRLNSTDSALTGPDPYHKGVSWLFAPVKINNVPVAYFSVMGDEEEFSDDELKTAETLCCVISVLLQKDEKVVRFARNSNSVFLYEILNGKEFDEKEITARFKMLGFPVYEKMRMIVIENISSQNISSSLAQNSIMESIVNSYLKNGICAAYQNKIAVLVNQDEFQKKFESGNEKIITEISEILRKNKLALGISNVFSRFSKIKAYFSQASEALEIGEVYDKENFIFFYEDYSLIHLFRTSPVDLKELCIKKIYEMYNSGTEIEREEARTLFLYLRNMKNVSETADFLHIHRNTLFYRVNQICQSANLDLNDGNDVFRILLTDKIIQYFEKKITSKNCHSRT